MVEVIGPTGVIRPDGEGPHVVTIRPLRNVERVGSAISLTPTSVTATELLVALTRRLDGYTVSELHGQVLVEHHRLGEEALIRSVKGALVRLYGPDWHQAVALD